MTDFNRRKFLGTAAASAAFAARVFAARRLQPDAPFRNDKSWRPLLNGVNLSGWHSELGSHGVPGRVEWFTTTAVSWSDANPKVLAATASPGGIIVNGVETHTTNLVADRKFGDIELYLEFMVSKDSNSGVYLHGLYEVQILDSYGKPEPMKYFDGGAFTSRWTRTTRASAAHRRVSMHVGLRGSGSIYHIWFEPPLQFRRQEDRRCQLHKGHLQRPARA